MRTIGTVVRDYRLKKKLSLEELEKITKIRKSFLASIEKEEWNKLPEYPVVQGFIRSLSGVLDANKDQLLAVFRRDYPPQKLSINPKPDLTRKFSWGPRLNLILGIIVVAGFVVSYLTYQYIKFVSPPPLRVDKPAENQIVGNKNLEVSGKTASGVSVLVNNQPALVNDDGTFKTEIEIFEGTELVRVVARSRNDKETIVERKIQVKLE